MADSVRSILLKDATLREGLDVAGVTFTLTERLAIVDALAGAGLPEAEVVGPSRALEDLNVAREIKSRGIPIRVSGLVYANGPGWRHEVESACEVLDRLDLLMPLSPHREPRDAPEKLTRLEEALDFCRGLPLEVGAGFPHATQAETDLVTEIADRSAETGARRITLYDTNGGAEPFGVGRLVERVASTVPVPVFFHAHNDLGLATANAWAAVRSGAWGLDVTVNGLGDRAGNASLEQVVLLLRLRGMRTNVDPSALRELSRLVADLSGLPVSVMAPVVGRHAFDHRSPAHRVAPTEFEAFDPDLVGVERRLPGVDAAAAHPRPDKAPGPDRGAAASAPPLSAR